MNKHEFNEKIENYILKLMNGKTDKFKDRFFLSLLFCISRFFRALVQWRLTLYTERIFRQHLPGCQIISVGNIAVGGTGKTPVVEFLTKTLLARKRRVAILSRGYRSKEKSSIKKLVDKFNGKKDLPRIVSDGKKVLLDSEYAGDEPFMLAKNLLPAVVLVDKNRVKSCNYATRHFGSDIIILDDGFQYLRLRPSYNICLIDSTNPFDNHHVMPRGLLREPIKNIRRANLIFLTKVTPGRNLTHLKRFITKHNKTAKIIECAHKPVKFINLKTNEEVSIDFIKDKKVASVTGIAVPEGFEKSLQKLGGELLYKQRFADHHRFHKSEIVNFINSSIECGAEMIMTTEKDAVRIPDIGELKIPIYYMKIEITIFHGKKHFDDFISRVLIEPKLIK